MDESVVRRVRNNLSAKFYTTNDTWLSECVEYYLNDRNNANDAEVLEFVVSQWLLSDLREISNEKPCLPKNLAQERCITLRGHFILQVEKVYDIAESKYKQLEKIRNICTDNIQATEVEATQAWEPKKKRMLQFFLTDGAQDVKAIEHKPIRFLNEKLLPGYKLMIKGPVMCRRGIIMLDETSVSEIGGEVESLLVPNATENLLARALKLPENPDPYNVKPKPAEDVLFDDDFDIDMEAVDRIEKLSQGETTKNPSSRTTNTNSSVQSGSDRTANRPLQPENEPLNELPLAPLVRETDSDLLFDMIDESEFVNIPEVAPKPQTVSKTVMKAPVRVSPRDSEFPDDDDDLMLVTDDPSFSDVENSWRNVKPTCQVGEISKLKIDPNSKTFAASSAQKITVAAPKPSTQVACKRTSAVLSPPVLKPPAEKVRCTISTPKSNKTSNRKITDYLKKGERPEVAAPVPKICDNVADILTANVTNNVISKTVRGKFDNFDKLGIDGDCWKLNATMTDNTGNVEVAFSTEILEETLGFSVAEFKLKKKLTKSNPEIKDQLRQGCRSAENKLKNLDALLEVELAPDQKPKIIKIKDLTDEQRRILDRSANSYNT